ncbi:MAG: DUF4491 family protein [Salinivirgaceae bacterium]|nr:DUF4491 family protein [Salinivirgaceae bacterium]
MTNYNGLIIGLISFLIIGICHPLVIKAEYYWGKQKWWVFFALGLAFAALSLFLRNSIASMIVGSIGFSLFWSAHEMILQHERVLLGRAKRNPNRTYTNFIAFVTPTFSVQGLCFDGLIVGAATFAIISIARYVCIKAEYHFGKIFWIGFLFIGIASIVASILISNTVLSVVCGIHGFTYLWGIGEIFEQAERVKKGWFPKKEKRE